MIGLLGVTSTTMGVATPLAQHDQELINAMEGSHQSQLDQIFSSKPIQNIFPETLGQVLVISIQKGLFQRYGPDILNQPEANNISPYDEWGVGHAVIMAIHMRDLPALQYMQRMHPVLFDRVPEDGEFGIGQALLSEFMHLNYIYEQGVGDLKADFLNILISHPMAHLIELEVPSLYGMDDFDFKKGEREIEQILGTQNMSLYLGLLLRYAVVNGKDVDLSIVQALLNQNIADLFEPNGAHGLGRALTNAAYFSNELFVQEISVPDKK